MGSVPFKLDYLLKLFVQFHIFLSHALWQSFWKFILISIGKFLTYFAQVCKNRFGMFVLLETAQVELKPIQFRHICCVYYSFVFPSFLQAAQAVCSLLVKSLLCGVNYLTAQNSSPWSDFT